MAGASPPRRFFSGPAASGTTGATPNGPCTVSVTTWSMARSKVVVHVGARRGTHVTPGKAEHTPEHSVSRLNPLRNRLVFNVHEARRTSLEEPARKPRRQGPLALGMLQRPPGLISGPQVCWLRVQSRIQHPRSGLLQRDVCASNPLLRAPAFDASKDTSLTHCVVVDSFSSQALPDRTTNPPGICTRYRLAVVPAKILSLDGVDLDHLCTGRGRVRQPCVRGKTFRSDGSRARRFGRLR